MGDGRTPPEGLADRAFSRAAGAPLVGGNKVRLLEDAGGNYPAWLEAIAAAARHVYFESYIIRDDETGRRFADALIARAEAGVRVRLIYDWLGCWRTPQRFWGRMRAAGVEVRCYNPLRPDRPLGWLSRDHRKMISVDGRVGFITGLCVSRDWEGDPDRGLAPWRDTGIEVRGPAVPDIERAFAQVWAATGDPLPEDEAGGEESPGPAGGVNVRVVASMPAGASLYRLDQIIAALARTRVWLTDAYYAATPPYVQALRAAAGDGVDVRLLLPHATDVPLARPLSRAGYRALLESGVRIFEWNGPMLHAKTAVADGRWARIGSTNLNVFGWFHNCELDAVVEDAGFAAAMEDMYLRDLENATEVVLDAKRRPRSPAGRSRAGISGGGSGGGAAAGAVRIGNAVAAAFSGRRALEPIEARLMMAGATVLIGLAALAALVPRLPAFLLAFACAWGAGALFFRGLSLLRRRRRGDRRSTAPPAGGPRK